MKLLDSARQLRNRSTDAERLFWNHVRARRLNGHKFKRQQQIGPYIVDFICLDAKLVVELDGGQHLHSEYDKVRDAWLVAEGFHVVRFWNNDIMTNLDGAIAKLLSVIGEIRQEASS